MRTDRVNWLTNSEAREVISFTRTDGLEEIFVLINLSSSPVTAAVPLV